MRTYALAELESVSGSGCSVPSLPAMMRSVKATADQPGQSVHGDDDIWARGAIRVAQAVTRYGICRATVYNMMSRGTLAYAKVGGVRLIPVVAMERMLSAGLVNAVGPGMTAAA